MNRVPEPLMSDIYFFRHGKTLWNVEGRLQGVLDSELVPEAIEEAKEVDRAFGDSSFDWAFRSPLKRVKATIDSMPRFKHIPWEIRPELKEISFGEYGGLLENEISAEFHERRAMDRWNTQWPGGESYQTVRERLTKFAAQLRKLEGTIAVFAHETVNRVLLGELDAWPKDRILASKQPHNVVYRINKIGVSSRVISEDWFSNVFFSKT